MDFTDWQTWALIVLGVLFVLSFINGDIHDHDQDARIKAIEIRPDPKPQTGTPAAGPDYDWLAKRLNHVQEELSKLQHLPTNKQEALGTWAREWVADKTNWKDRHESYGPGLSHGYRVPPELSPEQVAAIKAVLTENEECLPKHDEPFIVRPDNPDTV